MKKNLISPTIKTLTILYLYEIILFAFYRLFFIIRYRSEFAGIPFSDILKSFKVGLRTDLAIISYVFIPLFILAHLPYFGIEKKGIFRKVIFSYFWIFNIFLTTLFFINFEFFAEYNSHLNYTSIEYLDTSAPIMDMIWGEYPLIRYILFIVLISIGNFFAFRFFFRKTTAQKTYLVSRIFAFILGSGLLFLGMRGSTNEGVMRWGNAFFSEYNIVNQTALNPIYNLTKDIYYANQIKKKNINLDNDFFADDKEAIDFFRKFNQTKLDKYISDDFPLAKTSDFSDGEKAKDYNVVIILVETFAAELAGALGGKHNLTPNFDKLAEQGLLFNRFYTNGQRSNRAISAINTSYAGVPGKCIMLRPQGQQFIPSLPSILKQRDYSTHFFYGGDVDFDNMRGFLRSKGVDNFLGDKDFDKSNFINKWGALDGDLFERAIAEFDQAEKPFYATIYTLTNHEPFDVPPVDFPQIKIDNIDEKLLNNYNTLRYTDFVLGNFMKQMRQKEYFDKTIFVILGDHSKSYHHDLPFDYRKSHTPLLIYAPEIIGQEGKVDSLLCSQIDIAPTICDLLDLKINSSFMGQSLLSKNKNEWVIINRNRNFGYLRGDFYLSGKYGEYVPLFRYNDFSGNDISAEFPDVKKQMLKELYGISNTANSLYLKKRIGSNEY